MKKEEYLESANKYKEFEKFLVDRANRKYNVSDRYQKDMDFLSIGYFGLELYEGGIVVSATNYHWDGDYDEYSESLSIEEITMNDSEFAEHLEKIVAEIAMAKKSVREIQEKNEFEKSKQRYLELKKKFEND